MLALDGRELSEAVSDAAALLASVTGQDLEESEDGIFRIARRVAKDRIISTVDPDARHGHKTSARGGFYGYKGHVSVDPDSELILATAVTAANGGDAAAADELLADDLATTDQPPEAETAQSERAQAEQRADPERDDNEPPLSVYGDFGLRVRRAGEHARASGRAGQLQGAAAGLARGRRFSKDAFAIDLEGGTVSCPAGNTTSLRPFGEGQIAKFAAACDGYPLAPFSA